MDKEGYARIEAEKTNQGHGLKLKVEGSEYDLGLLVAGIVHGLLEEGVSKEFLEIGIDSAFEFYEEQNSSKRSKDRQAVKMDIDDIIKKLIED